MGGSEDVMFCHNCQHNNIRLLVDTRAYFKHLKISDEHSMELIYENKDKEPYIKYEFITNNNNNNKKSKTIPIKIEDKEKVYSNSPLAVPKPSRYIYESYSR